MTSLERLVLMANQIAANQMHEPDPIAATANHIHLFWDPRMKAQICEHSDALNATAAAAVLQLANG